MLGKKRVSCESNAEEKENAVPGSEVELSQNRKILRANRRFGSNDDGEDKDEVARPKFNFGS